MARTGAKNSFGSRAGRRPHCRGGRAGGILSIPAGQCPWGRLGSVLYTCNRLRRVRRRFKHFWSEFSQQAAGMNYLAMASRALGDH